MSHFEYVSVAIALMFALLVGRLLTGLTASFEPSRRYPVHAAWVVAMLLVAVMEWWVFWRASQVTWTPIRFLWALSIPSIVFVRAGVLLGSDPDSVTSFREHFFAHRVVFFAIGVLGGVQIVLTPWVLGVVPMLELAPAQPHGVMLILVSVAGLVLRGTTSHALLVLLSLLGIVSAFYLVPEVPPAS